jgi:hypothetical protein
MSASDQGPVVILGMHRSGTTLVAELARALGLELGKVTALMEPQRLVDLNEWLLRRSGGSWEYPLPALDLLSVPELRQEAQGHVRDFARRHLDPLASKPGGAGRRPWGWKDPRTAFTLPLWESVFPVMRLVAVRRHGFDTALSLHARARSELSEGRGPLQRWPLNVRLRNLTLRREERPMRSVRSQRLGSALSLWADYNRQVDAVLERTSHPVQRVRLEDLLDDPRGSLESLADFIGFDDVPARAERALAAVRLRDASRAAGYADVAAEARDDDLALLRSYGYETIPEGAA